MITPRPHIGAVNWIGVRTLYVKEVRRFLSVAKQTVAAPMITTLMFLAVFSLALGRAVSVVGGVPFIEFLAPGLIMMAIIQNSFENNSSSMMIAKLQGNIVDVLMPPLSPGELTFGYLMGGTTRGLTVGTAVAAGMSLFVPLHFAHPAFIFFHAAMAAMLLAQLGLIVAIWAEKVDQRAAATNFIIAPLAFLSGTFYSIDRLTGAWHVVSQFNPIFYLIDGFRYGFTGHADGSLLIGALVVAGLNLILCGVCYWMFASGYRLKP